MYLKPFGYSNKKAVLCQTSHNMDRYQVGQMTDEPFGSTQTESYQDEVDADSFVGGHLSSNNGVTPAIPVNDDELTDGPEFLKGDLVEVMARLWAGINKPGGAGRITKVHFDAEEDEYTYTVSYIVNGGRESNVEAVYIKHMHEDGSKKRSIRGRCRWCPSFVRDCGHNQDTDPFAVEVPALGPDTEQRVATKRKVAVDTAITEDLYFTSDGITSGVPQVDPRHKRKRHTDSHASHSSRKKRHVGDGEGEVHVKFKNSRKKYVSSVSSVDYQQLLSVLLEDSSLETTVGPSVESSVDIAGTTTSASISNVAALTEEQARANSIARANRVGVILIEDSDSDDNDNEPPQLGRHPERPINTGLSMSAVQVPAPSHVTNQMAPDAAVQAAANAPVLAILSAGTAALFGGPTPVPTARVSVALQPITSVPSGVSVQTTPPAAQPVHVTAQSAAPSRSSSVSAREPVSVSVDLARSTSTSSRASTSDTSVAISISQPPSSAPLIAMNELHRQILQSCVKERPSGGDADEEGFINNAANSHRDNAAARVNAVYNGLIESLSDLSRDQRVELFLCTFDWVQQSLPQKDEYLFDLMHLEQRLQHLVDGSYVLEALSEPQQQELGDIYDALGALTSEQDAYFKRIERAGLEILTRLRHTPSARVKKRMFVVSSWPTSINDARNTLHKRIRTFEDAYEDAVESWEYGQVDSSDETESEYSADDGGGSDADQRGSSIEHDREGAIMPADRMRDAAKEAGTIVRKPSVQRDEAAPRRSHSGSSQSKTSRIGGSSAGQNHAATGAVASIARTGSHGSHQSRESAARPSDVSHGVSRAGRVDEGVPQHKKARREGAHFSHGGAGERGDWQGGFDNDFGGYGGGDDDYCADPSAAQNVVDEVSYDAFASDSGASSIDDEDDRSHARARRTTGRGDRAGAARRGSHRYKTFVATSGSRSSASFVSTAATRHAGAGADSSGDRPRSKIQRDVEQVFGAPRSTAGRKKSTGGTRSATAGTEGDKVRPATGGDRSEKNALYSRRRPTVADLPAHVRYHGRVVVLESLLSNSASVPADSGSARNQFAPAIPAHFMAARHIPAHVSAAVRSSMPPAGVNLNIPESARVGTTLAVGNSALRSLHAPAAPVDRNRTRTSAGLPAAAQQSDTRGDTDAVEEAEEDLVDLVLSSMANPFVTEPPLHLQQPFYQVGRQRHQTDAKQVALKAWAVGFCARLSVDVAPDSVGGGSTTMSQLAATTLATVNEVLNRLTSYQDLEVRCSAVQNSCQSACDNADQAQSRGTALLNAQFQRKETWTALVAFGCEKVTRIGYLLREALGQCYDSTGGSHPGHLAQLMQQGYRALERRLCVHLTVVQMPEPEPARTSSGAAAKPRELLHPCDLAGSLMNMLGELHPHKCDEFAAFLHLSLLRHKVAALVEVALRTVEVAKCRSAVDSTDKAASAVRVDEERADWEVMNRCFSELLAIQDSVITALLWNKRLMLGILYHMSAHSAQNSAPPAESSILGVEFKRGVSCTIRMLAVLLFEVLLGLRRLHSIINAARICANGSASGGRIWACYDASREQVNGKIATYHKNVWTEIANTVSAQVARGKANVFGCDATCSTADALKRVIGSVNPSTWSLARSSGSSEGSGPEEDAVWGVLTVVSHCLRTVNIAVSSSGGQANAPISVVRVDGCWSLLRALADVSVNSICKQLSSSGAPSEVLSKRSELTAQLLRTLRRVSLLGAVWTDALSEAPALYLNILNQTAATFTTLLPVAVCRGLQTKSAATKSEIATKQAKVDDIVGALDSKSVMLLCFHAYFSCTKSSAGCSNTEGRSFMHHELLHVVSMLFKACGVPNPYDVAGSANSQSLDALLSGDATAEHQEAASQESMRVVNEIRRTFKALVYNATTEPCSGRDMAGITANIAAIKSAAAKVPKMYAKSTLLALLTTDSAASFQCGMLVCLLVKELSAIYGQDVVRNKLRLAALPPAGIGTGAAKESPLALQEQLMKSMVSAVVAEISSTTCDAGTSVAVGDGPVSSASLSAQVEKLLLRLPLHQQRDAEGGAANTVPTAVDARLSLTLCLYVFTGLLTFIPFPVENGSAVSTKAQGSSSVTEADVKRMLDAHRSNDLYMEPTLQVLRFIAKLHADRTLMQSPELMKALLGTALSACATILRYIDAGASEDCQVPLRCGTAEHSKVLCCLHVSLLKEISTAVQICLSQATGLKSRDGLHVSAVFVVGLLVQCLTKWRHQRTELLTALGTASNVDPAAAVVLQRNFTEDESSFHDVLAAFLHVQPVPMPFGRAAAPAVAATVTVMPTGSELVTSLKAVLVQLAGTLKSQDVTALDFSSTFATSDRGFSAAQMRKLKMRKLNTSAGACFAVCRSLGDLAAMLLNMAADAPSASGVDRQTQPPGVSGTASTVCSAAFVQSLTTEVLECSEKISVTAAGGNNILLGHWLRITFWVPVLQCISALCCRSCTIDVSSLLYAHIPSLISDWCSCAMVRESTAATRAITEHIGLSEYCEHLTTLSNVMVMSVHFKYASLGASKLSSSELQSWRLCELYLQVFEADPTDSMNRRDKAVQFLRLLASGGTSAVLGEVLLVNDSSLTGRTAPNATRAYVFPAAQRVAFEGTNTVLVRDLCRSLQCLTIAAFKTSDTKEQTRLKDLVTDLKALVAEASYLTRSLQHSPTLLARVKIPCINAPSAGGYGTMRVSYELDSVPLTAQLLREINQLPSMIPLDLVATFITDFIVPEVITLLNNMFQCVLGEHTRSNDPSRNGTSAVIPTAPPKISLQVLQELAERHLVCNLPRYILMTTGTPYSTRQVEWRRMLVPIFINSTYCTAGTAAGTAAGKDAENVLLSERTMDEVPYFMLLVWAITLALPLPERLAVLMPALQRDVADLLRADFEQLVSSHLKVPVKSSTMWKLFKIFSSTVASTVGPCTPAPAPAHTSGSSIGGALRQDPQLARFRQYLLLSAGAATTATTGVGYSAPSSAANNSTWLSITSQKNGLWELLHSSARSELDERIASEQGKLAVQTSKFAQTSAATVMTVLPWTAVKTALHLHVAAFDQVIDALIDQHGGTTASAAVADSSPVLIPPTSFQSVQPISQAPTALTSVEKEELLSLVITSAVHIVRVVLASVSVHQAITQRRLVLDSVKQRLLLLIQYCRLSAEAVASQCQHVCQIPASAETAVVRCWMALLRELRTLLSAPSVYVIEDGAVDPLDAFKSASLALLRELFGYVSCKNALSAQHVGAITCGSVQGFLATVTQCYGNCNCGFCSSLPSPVSAVVASALSDTCVHTLVHYMKTLDECNLGTMEGANLSGSLQVAGIHVADVCNELDGISVIV